METITTSDLYEGCYYLLNGCNITVIKGRILNKKISCDLTFEGENLLRLQIEYFQSRAIVNMFDFRRAYGKLNSLIYNAKKQLKNELKEQRIGGEV